MHKCVSFMLVCIIEIGGSVQEVSPYGNGLLPFPQCHAYDVNCLRRGIRTFFFLMDAQCYGMKQVDPTYLSSVTISFPDQQIDFKLRNLNVSGARWTKLIDRKFNLPGGKSSVIFSSDLHITAEVLVNIAEVFEPYWAHITMDIQNVESNITYLWLGHRAIDKEDYILIGRERVAVRNSRRPTYFLQPVSEASKIIDEILKKKPSILEHLSNEVKAALMHIITDNFRSFAQKVPVRFYYKYT